MYPIAHAWLIERLIPAPEAATYLGCVWPDMLYHSPLTHAQSHRQGERLVARLRALPPGATRDEFATFVAGALSHGSEPHGFDWYSDERWGDLPAADRGYAFQRSRSLAQDAARACGLPPEEGWWKAHNLVEMAFEPDLYRTSPHLGRRLADACADRPLIARIADQLAGCFAVEPAQLAEAMARFPDVVALHPTDAGVLAGVYALQVRLKHGTEADASALAALIERALGLIAADRQKFLETCVARVGPILAAVEC